MRCDGAARQGLQRSVGVDNLHAMEDLRSKLSSRYGRPSCSGLSKARAERGRKIFDRTCALCHETTASRGRSTNTSCSPRHRRNRSEHGDQLRAHGMTAEGPKPFGLAAFEIVKKVKAAYYAEHNIPPDVQARWESRATRGEAEFRAPLLSTEITDTRQRGVYRAKTLKGPRRLRVFSTTARPRACSIYPAANERPTTFKLGTKEYDPVKLGYVVDGPRFLTPPRIQPFTGHTADRELEHGPRMVVLPGSRGRGALRHHRVPEDVRRPDLPGAVASSGRPTRRRPCRWTRACRRRARIASV